MSVDSFPERLDALTRDAAAFAEPRMAEIREKLASIDSIIGALQAAGIMVETFQSRSLNPKFAECRFRLSLNRKLGGDL